MYRILVPLDGSQLAEQALRLAGLIAQTGLAEVKLLHVLEDLQFPEPPSREEEDWLRTTARDDALVYLEQAASDLKATSAVAAAPAVVAGVPYEVILEEAARWKAQLIVMATHGRGAFDRAWLGSVADAVMRESIVPVVLVHVRPDQPAPSVRPIRHIVIPLDGSQVAEQILAPALLLAQRSSARVTLLRAVRPWVVATRPMASAPRLAVMREHALAAREREARDYLTRSAAELPLQSLNVATDVVVSESSEANEIMRYADEHSADLIALATRGHSGVRRLTVGSVADKLIRGTAIPVMVLRPV